MKYKLKQLLKPMYHKYLAVKCIFRRTIFAPLYGIKIPFNRNIQIGSRVRFSNGIRVYYYAGKMYLDDFTEICSFSKIIMGGVLLK